MSKLEKTILWILAGAKEFGLKDLSKLQVHKIVYLIDVESRKYAGESFFANEVTFIRQKLGPLSLQVYNALGALSGRYLEMEISDGPKYTSARHGYKIRDDIELEEFRLDDGDMMFLGSVIQDLITVDQGKLKKIAYSTEPMVEQIAKEKAAGADFIPGDVLNMDLVSMDEELVMVLSDE